ncbi:MAG: Mur ligase family protein, partial [Mariprofundaceae bacterium]|nr:Mur ligase family protein [Mariprofundaceae bacterium]
MRLTGQELAIATQGVWHQGHLDDITLITTDSRNFQQGSVFLALRGDAFDGHQCAPDSASALIGDSEGVQAWKGRHTPYLEVSDTLQALGDIAHAWREKLTQTTVIGITGSYGKTTVRSMLSHLLTGLGLRVHATHANLNNVIGVPQTVLATPIHADVALIECGISEQGEMQRLADILSPDGVVMTGISSAHAEGLGGFQGVIQEKARLLLAIKTGGWCALGKGVASCLQAEHINIACQTVSHAVTWTRQGLKATFHYQGESAHVSLSLPADHWCDNMALVLSIALEILEQLPVSAHFHHMVTQLSTWSAVDGRLQICKGIAGCHILNDA